MAFKITGFFAALLGLLYFMLSLATIRIRRKARIPVGEGVPVNKDLRKCIRAHGNFSEYVPLALVLLALIEGGSAAPAPVTGALGAILFAARISHGWALAIGDRNYMFRFLGTLGTLAVINVSCALLLWSSVRGPSAA